MKNFHSLRVKIAAVFCVCVIIPLLGVNLVVFKWYQQNLEESTVRVYDMVSDQIETNLDTYLTAVKRISLYPYYNNQIQEILYDISIHGDRSVMTRENNDIMNDFLFNMLIQDQEIQSVFITDLDGNVVYNKSNGGYYRDTDYFKSYIASMDEEFLIIPTHPQSYVNRTRKNVFSYVRVIKEVNTNTPIGYAILEMDSGLILEMTEKNSDVSDAYIAVTLQDGSMLNGTIPEEQLEAFSEYFSETGRDDSEGSVIIDGDRYLLSVSAKSDNDLVTWIFQKEEVVMSGLNQMARVTTLILILVSAAVLAATVVASRQLTAPLVHLRDAMMQVKHGNFKAKVKKAGGRDEVGELTDCFNSMLDAIDDLITREYKLKLQERDANLQALQNQINPHFLYNTLESITMMAEINDDTDVAEMVTDLGKFMRFTLTTRDAMVRLSEELACVENYVQIQNVRYDHCISLSVDCPEKLADNRIVKLSIQPVVENAILHGTGGAGSGIHLRIRVREENSDMEILIADDGQGMDPETLAGVIKNLEQGEETERPGQSIGLKNVHQRIKLRYGEKYGLKITSKPGKGTEVRLLLPCSREESHA